ncbi:ubiquitin ligase (cullin) of SCF [Savitreella phatthalungensis]
MATSTGQPRAKPPKVEDLEATWSYLQDGVSDIMETLHRGMSFQRCIELYTVIYNFCTQNKMHRFGDGSGSGAGGGKGAHLMGAELYERLTQYMQRHLSRLLDGARDLQGEPLLVYYTKCWRDYTVGAGFVHHIFRYLNRYWVKREMDEGKAQVYDIYTLCLVLWRRILFEDIHEKLLVAVLIHIERHREGEPVETQLIKNAIDSYVSLGIDQQDPTRSTLDVYETHFSKRFLEATAAYYSRESEQFIQHNEVPDYLKKAETRLHEESERVDLYLHPSSLRPLLQTCEKALISAHAELLQEQFRVLLEHERREDMERMYRLLERVPDGLGPLRETFEDHVRKAGLAAVERIAPTGGEDSTVEPKDYVDSLLGVHTLYNSLVTANFNGDAEFVKSLDNACREYVNRNSICKSTSSSSRSSPELLAKYCDNLLKKGSRMADEGDVEQLLQNVMVVFKYVEDKDVFQKFYTRHLSRRLVGGQSASDDAEASMLTKLKEACGFEYTNKLQRMYNDMQISQTLQNEFRRSQEQNESTAPFDMDVLVLGGAFWPLTPPSTEFRIPQQLTKAYEQFHNFYNGKHSGRKLQWLFQHSKADIRVNFADKKYIFSVSTYQMAILLAFNDALTLSYEELQAQTGLTAKEQLTGALNIMLKAKVLLLESGTGGLGEAGSRYTLNENFKSKKLKINLNMPIKSEQKHEAEETHKTIEEDRKLLTQSAIVRIMKARKQLKHTLLVQETISQVKSRFTPRIPDIKKCIDILIEKEYLERSGKDEYQYLA